MQAKVASKTRPQRSCVTCRQVKDKQQLVRLVCTAEGVVLDPGGHLAGRGAYLCRSAACWQEALKGKRLENALKANLSRENRQKLGEYAATFGEE